jgi:hypothetical protein
VTLENRLSDVLGEFARTLSIDFPIQGILDHRVQRIVDVLPIDAAGVTITSPTTNPRFIGASDESAMRFEQFQTDLGEGPCLAAYLHGDQRFSRFATVAEGVENDEQYESILELGCDFYQGHHFSPSLSAGPFRHLGVPTGAP